MDTKSLAEKILGETAYLDGFDDVKEVCETYLTQCQEVERLEAKSIITDELKRHYRNNALEEAAKVADSDQTDCENASHHAGCIAGYYIAITIRNLKDKQ